jgi:hypothetical protein
VETVEAINIGKFIMNLKTFLATMRSELRPDGMRREYDQKLFVAMEELEDAMHAHLSGSWRLSKFFVAIRKHEMVRAAREHVPVPSYAKTPRQCPLSNLDGGARGCRYCVTLCYAQVYTTIEQLEALNFKVHNTGSWRQSEINALTTAVEAYAARPMAFADGTYTDEHWGDGEGQTTNLLTWLVKTVPTRRAGAVAARVQQILVKRSDVDGARVC